MRLVAVLILVMLSTIAGMTPAYAKPKLNYKFFQVGNQKRSWWEYVPVYCANQLCPMIIAYHGNENSGDRFDDVTQFVTLSEQKKFIIIYPESIQGKWSEVDGEFRFFDVLIEDLKSRLKVDPKKIFATGFSVGGVFTFRLACERGDVISGIAPVMASMDSSQPATCKPKKAIPIINFIGTADRVMPMNGGEVKNALGLKKMGEVFSTNETLNFWIRNNQCSNKPTVDGVRDNDKNDETHAVLEKYLHCKDNAIIHRWVIGDGGHNWPSAVVRGKPLHGKTSKEVNASAEIVDFLLRPVR